MANLSVKINVNNWNQMGFLSVLSVSIKTKS